MNGMRSTLSDILVRLSDLAAGYPSAGVSEAIAALSARQVRTQMRVLITGEDAQERNIVADGIKASWPEVGVINVPLPLGNTEARKAFIAAHADVDAIALALTCERLASATAVQSVAALSEAGLRVILYSCAHIDRIVEDEQPDLKLYGQAKLAQYSSFGEQALVFVNQQDVRPVVSLLRTVGAELASYRDRMAAAQAHWIARTIHAEVLAKQQTIKHAVAEVEVMAQSAASHQRHKANEEAIRATRFHNGLTTARELARGRAGTFGFEVSEKVPTWLDRLDLGPAKELQGKSSNADRARQEATRRALDAVTHLVANELNQRVESEAVSLLTRLYEEAGVAMPAEGLAHFLTPLRSLTGTTFDTLNVPTRTPAKNDVTAQPSLLLLALGGALGLGAFFIPPPLRLILGFSAVGTICLYGIQQMGASQSSSPGDTFKATLIFTIAERARHNLPTIVGDAADKAIDLARDDIQQKLEAERASVKINNSDQYDAIQARSAELREQMNRIAADLATVEEIFQR